MFDKELAASILRQIAQALETISSRFSEIHAVQDFTDSPSGKEKLDGICMQFIVIGESLKRIDKITQHGLLPNYPGVDWKGIMGFRDIITHHYFDIDAEEVFWICTYELDRLLGTIKKIIRDLV